MEIIPPLPDLSKTVPPFKKLRIIPPLWDISSKQASLQFTGWKGDDSAFSLLKSFNANHHLLHSFSLLPFLLLPSFLPYSSFLQNNHCYNLPQFHLSLFFSRNLVNLQLLEVRAKKNLDSPTDSPKVLFFLKF